MFAPESVARNANTPSVMICVAPTRIRATIVKRLNDGKRNLVSVYDDSLDANILQKAYQNTIELLKGTNKSRRLTQRHESCSTFWCGENGRAEFGVE